MNWLNFAALLCYGYVPDPMDRQSVEPCHSQEDDLDMTEALQNVFDEGKAHLHRLPSAADLDAIAEEDRIRKDTA